jgi:hypothetical protein
MIILLAVSRIAALELLGICVFADACNKLPILFALFFCKNHRSHQIWYTACIQTTGQQYETQ